jgi:hypothetical protein
MEEVARWKTTRGRFRAERTSFIASNYLLSPKKAGSKEESENRVPSGQTHATSEESTGEGESASPETAVNNDVAPQFELPPKTEIKEYDLFREPVSFTSDEIKELSTKNIDPTKNCIAIGGEVLQTILKQLDRLRNTPGFKSLPEYSLHDKGVDNDEEEEGGEDNGNDNAESTSERAKSSERARVLSLMTQDLPESLFDSAEVIVAERVREKYWEGFKASEQYTKLLNFLWFQDKKVVEEDFFVMRVLGRGGFGLVTGKKLLSR